MKQKFDTLLEIHDLSVSFRMYDRALEQKDLQVISAEEYREKWDRFCDDHFA